MLNTLHAASAGLLIVSHLTFLLRAIALRRKKLSPRKIDILARNLSQIMLAITVITGLILYISGKGNHSFFPHPLSGLLPLLAIPAVNAGRIIAAKRRKIPWLLPFLNLAFILGALATGFLFKEA